MLGKRGRDRKQDIDITARQAVSARRLKPNKLQLSAKMPAKNAMKKSSRTAEIRDAEDKYLDAQNQITDLREELARETRNRELAERDAMNYSNQLRELREENRRLSEQVGKLKVENDNYKQKITQFETEKQTNQEEQDKQARIQQIMANQGILIQSLKRFGTVRQNERGIVLTLPENYWTTSRVSSFSRTGEPKLNDLANVLLNNPDYQIMIESHTDNRGDADVLQSLTQERAQAIADKFTSIGADQNRVEAKGMGASLPIVANSTNANRAKNRRVDIVLTLIQ